MFTPPAAVTPGSWRKAIGEVVEKGIAPGRLRIACGQADPEGQHVLRVEPRVDELQPHQALEREASRR